MIQTDTRRQQFTKRWIRLQLALIAIAFTISVIASMTSAFMTIFGGGAAPAACTQR